MGIEEFHEKLQQMLFECLDQEDISVSWDPATGKLRRAERAPPGAQHLLPLPPRSRARGTCNHTKKTWMVEWEGILYILCPASRLPESGEVKHPKDAWLDTARAEGEASPAELLRQVCLDCDTIQMQ